MSDIFTLKTIPLTAEIGMALKNFRIEHEITASSITDEFSKSSSYITKLEKGDIKKVDSIFFIKLCNYITSTEDGLTDFLRKVSHNYKEYSSETKIIINNIDDLLINHQIPSTLITHINTYMQNHNISAIQLVNKINANEDILDNPSFSNAPYNQWYLSNNDECDSIIKLDIPLLYIEDFLNNRITTIHFVIGQAILYALYRLGNEDEPDILANNQLQINKISHYVRPNYIAFNDSNLDTLFGGLPLETAETLRSITFSLKLVANVTRDQDYGPKRINQIKTNLDNDLGFAFAFMSQNLEGLAPKSQEQKSKFLKDLKELINKYSQTNIGLDLYD